MTISSTGMATHRGSAFLVRAKPCRESKRVSSGNLTRSLSGRLA